MILAMGIFYGGIAQVIAGIMEWRKGNTFASTAFISYGFFWLTLVALLVIPKIGWWDKTDGNANTMGAFLFMWGLFPLIIFIGTFKLNHALQFVFGSLFVLFFLLSYGEFSAKESVATIAGYEGIICGLSAIYTGLAQVLNEVYGKVILPLGIMKKD